MTSPLNYIRQNKKKVAAVGLGAAVVGAGLFGASKLKGKLKKTLGIGGSKQKKSTVARLRSRVQKTQLKLKLLQLKRKLFREELKV